MPDKTVKLDRKVPEFLVARHRRGHVEEVGRGGSQAGRVLLSQGQHVGLHQRRHRIPRPVPKFRKADTDAVGVSPDTLASHDKFKAKYESFELLADVDRKVCGLFDVIREKSMYGRNSWVERSTFLLDENGVLRREWRKAVVADTPRPSSTPPANSDHRAAVAALRSQTLPPKKKPSAAPHLRPRHQRAHARPVVDFPLRGTRHLHPDDRSRGADAGKRGMSEGARNVRQVARFLDELMRERHQGADRSRSRAAFEVHQRRRQAPAIRTAVFSDASARHRPA